MSNQGFGTAVNCMDGRVQEAVSSWMRERYQVQWIDTITEAGPVAALARGDESILAGIRFRADISIQAHESVGMCVAGHEGCAGMPPNLTHDDEIAITLSAAKVLRKCYPQLPVAALWVGLDGSVTVLD